MRRMMMEIVTMQHGGLLRLTVTAIHRYDSARVTRSFNATRGCVHPSISKGERV